MNTLFISDLHLDLARAAILEQFEAFIRDEAVNADALYILGDLFEAWIGDDANDPVGKRFIAAMKPMREAHRPCFFMHGNRDFLLGERFAREAGLTLLPDPSIIDLYGTPTLLMHGDSLCTDDAPYQAFRRQSRSAEWQRHFLAQSVQQREAFARKAREESQRYTSSEANVGIMDVNQHAVEAAMSTPGIYRLIHGHTHRPFAHRLTIGEYPAERIVLKDWYQEGGTLRVGRDSMVMDAIGEQLFRVNRES